MEKDNMLLLELTEDELDVVAGGWSNSCGCGCKEHLHAHQAQIFTSANGDNL